MQKPSPVEPVEFHINLPGLIGTTTDEIDSEIVWGVVLALHDAMINKLESACRRSHPNWAAKEVKQVASLSLLNWLNDAGHHGAGDGLTLFLVLRELLLGDLDICEQLARNWIKECGVSGAQKSAIDFMSKFATTGMKFFISDGNNKRLLDIKERHKTIHADIKKLLADGVSKTAVYARLAVRHEITVRQLQRIEKKYKNDI